MATVYLGRIVSGFGFEREVAIKLLHAHLRSPAVEQDLVEEAKLAARVRHPNVVQTLDVGEDGGWVYLVMDYVEGDALSGLIKGLRHNRGVSAAVAMRALVDALRGLHAAHELRDMSGAALGVVHRDVSPQNVLVGLDGVARLADFGIAKAALRLGHTSTGIVKGKLGYMAPEQALGKPLDRRADVWAAAVVAWEIVARRPLFGRANDASVLLDVVSHDAPRLRSIDPDLPAELDDAVAAALERDPRHRVPTAEALADALERACRGSDLELADTREVAEAVALVAGPRLAERRQAVHEMQLLRSKMSALAERSQREQADTTAADDTRREGAATTDVAAEVAAEEASVEPGEPAIEAGQAPPASAGRTRRRLLAASAVLTALALGVWASASLEGVGAPAEDPAVEEKEARVEEAGVEEAGVEASSTASIAREEPPPLSTASAASAAEPRAAPKTKRAAPTPSAPSADASGGPIKHNPYRADDEDP
jgi:serine/threonine-protein kinase